MLAEAGNMHNNTRHISTVAARWYLFFATIRRN
jgi:hypothetical protein